MSMELNINSETFKEGIKKAINSAYGKPSGVHPSNPEYARMNMPLSLVTEIGKSISRQMDEEEWLNRRMMLTSMDEMHNYPNRIVHSSDRFDALAYAQMTKSMYSSKKRTKSPCNIKNVIFNDPATIVYWLDGTKTVVKCENEAFDPEKGLAMAISKKALGNEGYYYDTFTKWLPEEKHGEDLYNGILSAMKGPTCESLYKAVQMNTICSNINNKSRSIKVSNAKQLNAQGYSINEISSKLKLSEDTVIRLLFDDRDITDESSKVLPYTPADMMPDLGTSIDPSNMAETAANNAVAQTSYCNDYKNEQRSLLGISVENVNTDEVQVKLNANGISYIKSLQDDSSLKLVLHDDDILKVESSDPTKMSLDVHEYTGPSFRNRDADVVMAHELQGRGYSIAGIAATMGYISPATVRNLLLDTAKTKESLEKQNKNAVMELKAKGFAIEGISLNLCLPEWLVINILHMDEKQEILDRHADLEKVFPAVNPEDVSNIITESSVSMSMDTTNTNIDRENEILSHASFDKWGKGFDNGYFYAGKRSKIVCAGDCYHVKNIKPENRLKYFTLEAAIADGCRICKHCHGEHKNEVQE